MANKKLVFCQSIPVFTTHLRPYDASEKKNFRFEGTNGLYNMMSRLVATINNDTLKIFRKKKEKNQLLYDLQMKFNDLYDEIDNILSGKKGNIRQLSGGRYNFSSRNVIVQNPNLRIDQITLPYKCLVELLQQQIINVLQKSYNMSYNDAYKIWYKGNIQKDELIVQIINGLMWANPNGLPIIINLNPTIARGGILQVFCVGMTDTYTMGIPLQILKLLAADFDGDVLNIFYIINRAFYERSFQVLNPRNSMYISNNDGKLNTDVMHQRDTLINANTLVRLGRGSYTAEELAKIEQLRKSS
jgi:DNA-directed RNA polymerase beta' subunit